jgi:TonB family protein
MGRSRRALTVSLSILMLFVMASAKPKHEPRAGAEQPNLLHNSTGEFVWLTQRRLMKRVTHCVPPALPTGGTLRLKSAVTVEIRIGADGKVEAARVTQGHPLLHQAVIEAVRNWTFKPMIVRGKARGVVGRMTFVLSTLDGPTKTPACLRGF